MQNRFEKFNLVCTIFILLFVYTIFSITIYSQDDVIRVDTNLVTVPVTVLDREGRYITNLKKEDFQIFEDGIKQETVSFDSVEQSFTVFLLLDVSGSMSYHLAELTQAANALVRQLRPDDQVSAASFANDLYILLKPTKVSELRKDIKIQQRPGDSYTRIYDAIDDALKQMKKIRGRKAIVLFSDGAGDGIFSSAKDNFRNAEENETLIYTVQFNTFPSVPHPVTNKKKFYESIEEANKYMLDLARITGGRPYQIEKIADLEKTFELIAKELSQQYSLGYYPKQPGKKGERRQIKVKVTVPNTAVRARDNYVVGSSKKNRQK